MPRSASACAQQRLGHRAAAGVAGADEEHVHPSARYPHGASRPAARRSSARGMAPSRISRGIGAGAVDQCGRRHVAEHAAVEHQQLACVDLRAETSRERVGARAGGWPGRLAEVEVSGRPMRRDQPRDPAMRGVPHGDAALAAPQLVRQLPLAARQHQGQRPGPERVGQRARRRGEHQPPRLGHRPAGDQQQERLAGRPALEPRERRERRLRRRGAEAVDGLGGIGQQAASGRDVAATGGIAAAISSSVSERQDHRLGRRRKQLGEQRDRRVS